MEPNTNHSPLMIKMALAYFAFAEPRRAFSHKQWNSPAACNVRDILKEEGMISCSGQPLPRLKAYVNKLTSIPFPVAVKTVTWQFPEGDNA